MKANQLLNFVIKPTLVYLELDSPSAENLLLGTCAQETLMGQYIKQINGPALSPYGIESKTHTNIVSTTGTKYPSLYKKIIQLRSVRNQYSNDDFELLTNLAYATAIARLRYYLWAPELPPANDIPALAAYWKKYYNTVDGAGTEQQFIENYKRYVNI